MTNKCKFFLSFFLQTDGTKNIGLSERSKYFKEGKIWECTSRIHTDLWAQNRYIVPNINLRLVLWRGSPRFHIISPDPDPDYELEILRSYLIVHYIDAAPALTQSVNELLSSAGSALYYLSLSKLKTVTISKGDGSCSITDVFSSGSLPQELVFCLVRSANFRGSWNSNPFQLEHANISSILTQIDEEPSPYSTAITCDFSKEFYSEIYNNLFTVNPYGVFGESGKKCAITKKEFLQGTTIFRVVFSPVDQNILQPTPRSGKLSLDITFRENLKESYTLILYAKFPAVLELTSSGQIQLKA